MILAEQYVTPFKEALLSIAVGKLNAIRTTDVTPSQFEILDLTRDTATGSPRLVVDAKIDGDVYLRVYHYLGGKIPSASQLFWDANIANNADVATQMATCSVQDPYKLTDAMYASLSRLLDLYGTEPSEEEVIALEGFVEWATTAIPDGASTLNGTANTMAYSGFTANTGDLSAYSYAGIIASKGSLWAIPSDDISPIVEIPFVNNAPSGGGAIYGSEGPALKTAARDSDGNIVSINGGYVWVLYTTSKVTTVFNTTWLGTVYGSVCLSNGNVATLGRSVQTSNLMLLEWDRLGETLIETVLSGYQLGTPNRLLLGADGLLYIVTYSTIARCNQDGTNYVQWSISTQTPKGLVWDASGTPWVYNTTAFTQLNLDGSATTTTIAITGNTDYSANKPVKHPNGKFFFPWRQNTQSDVVAVNLGALTQDVYSGLTLPSGKLWEEGCLGYDGSLYFAGKLLPSLAVITDPGGTYPPNVAWVESPYTNNF